MKHIIQVHLEHKNNVIREIEIPAEKSLKDLHYAIINSLDLDKNEMASFYTTNEELELVQEVPLFKIDEQNNSTPDMSEITIGSMFPNINIQLIYVYDFLKMWRFLISYSQNSQNNSKTIDIINSIGKMPKEAPDIIFQTNKRFDPFDEAFKNPDEFNESEY